jgi:hypothetical protein
MRAPVLAIGDGALGFWGCAAGGLPGHPRAALLVSQDRQRVGGAPEGCTSRGEEGPRRDLAGRGRPARVRRGQGLRRRLRRQVPQGGHQDHRRSRRATRLLRLPRRALDPSAHH